MSDVCTVPRCDSATDTIVETRPMCGLHAAAYRARHPAPSLCRRPGCSYPAETMSDSGDPDQCGLHAETAQGVVPYAAPCPQCGTDAEWAGREGNIALGGSRADQLIVDCPACYPCPPECR